MYLDAPLDTICWFLVRGGGIGEAVEAVLITEVKVSSKTSNGLLGLNSIGVSRSTLPESTLESRVFEAGVELVSAGSLLGAASTTEFGFSSATCKIILGHFRLGPLYRHGQPH